MKVAIFSDLHIREDDQKLNLAFAKLLRELVEVEKITDLWLLGDILDVLVGPFSFWFDSYKEIFDALKILKQKGVNILWFEGNHDFFIQRLLHKIDIEVADGEQTYVVGEKKQKLLLAHGDLVNPEDKDYLVWRKITRSMGYRMVLGSLPSIVVKNFLKPWAQVISDKSRQKSSEHGLDLKKMYRNFAQKKFSEGYDAVILGHCHVEDFFQEGNKFYLNLGSALDGTVRYAIWDVEHESFPNALKYSKM